MNEETKQIINNTLVGANKAIADIHKDLDQMTGVLHPSDLKDIAGRIRAATQTISFGLRLVGELVNKQEGESDAEVSKNPNDTSHE